MRPTASPPWATPVRVTSRSGARSPAPSPGGPSGGPPAGPPGGGAGRAGRAGRARRTEREGRLALVRGRLRRQTLLEQVAHQTGVGPPAGLLHHRADEEHDGVLLARA